MTTFTWETSFAALLPLPILFLLSTLYVKVYAPKWALREYEVTAKEWAGYSINASILASFVAIATALHGFQPFFVTVFAITVYYFVLAGQSDSKNHYIPKELSSHFIAISICLATIGALLHQFNAIAIDDSINPVMQLITYQTVVTVVIFGLMNLALQAMGFADTKMLWGFGFADAWFMSSAQATGLIGLTCAFLLANIWINQIQANKNPRKKKFVAILPSLAGAFVILILLS